MCTVCGLSDPAVETEDLWASRSPTENMKIAIAAMSRGDRFFAKCLMVFERERESAKAYRRDQSTHWEGF